MFWEGRVPGLSLLRILSQSKKYIDLYIIPSPFLNLQKPLKLNADRTKVYNSKNCRLVNKVTMIKYSNGLSFSLTTSI